MNRLFCRGWWKTSFDRLRGKKPTQEFVPFGEKGLAKQISKDPMNRMNPRYKFGIWLGTPCFIGNVDGVFRAREIKRLELQSRWDKEAVNNAIGALWRMTDGRWRVDRPEIRVDPFLIPPLPFEGTRSRCWMPRLQRNQRQQKGASQFRSLQSDVSESLPTEQNDWIEGKRFSMRRWLRR